MSDNKEPVASLKYKNCRLNFVPAPPGSEEDHLVVVNYPKAKLQDGTKVAKEDTTHIQLEEAIASIDEFNTQFMFFVGMSLIINKSIYDYGADHHPPGYIAYRGEVVIIRDIDCSGINIAVSHPHVKDNSFVVSLDEVCLPHLFTA